MTPAQQPPVAHMTGARTPGTLRATASKAVIPLSILPLIGACFLWFGQRRENTAATPAPAKPAVISIDGHALTYSGTAGSDRFQITRRTTARSLLQWLHHEAAAG